MGSGAGEGRTAVDVGAVSKNSADVGRAFELHVELVA